MVKHYHSLALFSLVVYSILLINTDDKSLVSFVDGFSNRATFGSSTSSKRYQSSYTSLPSTIKLVKANHHHISRLVPLYMSVGDDNDINKSNNSEDTDTTTTTTEEQLQKRFEEAMNRRKQRGVLKDEGIEMKKSAGINNEEVESIIRDSDSTVTTNIKSTNQDESTLKSSTIEDEEDEDEAAQPTSKRRPIQTRYDDERFLSSPSSKSSARSLRRDDDRQSFERYSTDNYEDDEYSYVSDPDNNQYNDDEYYDERRYRSSRSTPKCEWETYLSTSIVFPPQLLLDESNNKDIPSRPKAIIHFIGGTFFGSYPRKFYGSLLEDIAIKCNAVVVATPIPLVLPGKGLVNNVEKWMFDEGGVDDDDYGRRKRRRGDTKATNNPLDHLSLAESIQRNFNNVYRDVVLDEYCTYMNATEVEDFMKDVPIVGIGHSLGARIQAISCSHPSISQRCLSMGKGNRLIRSGRDGMVYLGFANWGASSSIPGVETLDRTVKKRKRGKQRQEQQRRRGTGRRDDVWDRRRPQSSSRRRRSRDDDRTRRYSRYDRYEAEDLDLVDVFGDVVQDVVKGAKQIGDALTPETEDLEFTPTPNELWDDISAPGGCYRQSSRSNLIVQFDDDPIDQGSRLARTLLTAYDEVEEKDSESNSTKVKGDDDDSPLPHDVKFARLSGGHLTPVTVREGIAKVLPRGAVSLLSSSYNFILKQLNDERMGKSSQRQKREVKDVANTIASYIESLSDNVISNTSAVTT